MKKEWGRLKDAREQACKISAARVGEIFGRWVDLRGNLWEPKRLRLFSPHKNLPAFSVPGP